MSYKASRTPAPPSARDLMQDQLKQKSATRLVNSPHAKYNSRGQLMCIVCGCPVKSAIVWQAHVTKKSHIENLKTLRQRQEQLNKVHQSVKRRAAFAPPSSNPRKKKHTETKPAAVPIKGILKGIKSYQSSSSSESEEEDADANRPNVKATDPKSEIKEEVKEETQDNISNKDEEEEKEEEEDDDDDEKTEHMAVDDPTGYYLTEADKAKPPPPPKPNTTEDLPEGFFDDPVADAKARKVEYVNKDEAEWNAFMREVSAAETTSRRIIADDTEEAARRRQIQQAEEQMQLYQRVLNFDREQHQRQEQLGGNRNTAADGGGDTKMEQEEDSDSDDDDDLSTFNWRSKNACL